MIVRPVTPKDASAWVDLRRALWPGQESEHAAEVSLLQKGPVVADSDRLDLVTVFATGNPVLIATAKLALEASGIRFLTKGEGIQDLIGLGRLFGGVSLATGARAIHAARPDAGQAVEGVRDPRAGG